DRIFGAKSAPPVRGLYEPWMLLREDYFFAAEYTPGSQTNKGGGCGDESEDIEVLEPTFGEALEMVGRGEIIDAKTIMLLQYAKLAGLMRCGDAPVRQPATAPKSEAKVRPQ